MIAITLDNFQQGLMAAVLDQDEAGNVTRKTGVMGIVLVSGSVLPGDDIRVELPDEPHASLVTV